jgi:hypothetical protein
MEITIVETRFVVEKNVTDSFDRPMLLTSRSDSFDVDSRRGFSACVMG